MSDTPQIHKAEPNETARLKSAGEYIPCRHCGEAIKRVPGGQGPTWVHVATGAVAGLGGAR